MLAKEKIRNLVGRSSHDLSCRKVAGTVWEPEWYKFLCCTANPC